LLCALWILILRTQPTDKPIGFFLRAFLVERYELFQNGFFGKVRRPAISSGYSGIEDRNN
jgi:hypothetical protein